MNPIIEWVIPILETHEDIVVPVKKLWTMYVVAHPPVTLEEFTDALEHDERMEFMEGTDLTEGLEDWTEEEKAVHIAEMEALGFFGGPRVKLRSREITAEHIAKMLKKHTDNMMKALWNAFDVRPADSEQDAELLDLIARAKELQLKIEELLPPPDEEATERES